MVYSHCGLITGIGPRAMMTLHDVTDALGPVREQRIHIAGQPGGLTQVFALERFGYE